MRHSIARNMRCDWPLHFVLLTNGLADPLITGSFRKR
jgi:hypothetical protein